MKSYLVSLEIAGKTAMWSRADSSGARRASECIPSESAVRGIFETIHWGQATRVIPWKVEICSPLNFHNYIFNHSGGLERKSILLSKGNSQQMCMSVLTDVCYRLYAYAMPNLANKELYSEKTKKWDAKTTSPGHAYQAIFNRKLKKGRWVSMPHLGLKEFVADYVGPFREGTKIQEDLNFVLPTLRKDIFSDGFMSEMKNDNFEVNAKIVNGVYFYQKEAK